MSQRWYIFHNEVAHGPISSCKFQELASAKLSPERLVSLGKPFKWIKAAKVKGLFPESAQAPISKESKSQQDFQQLVTVLAESDAKLREKDRRISQLEGDVSSCKDVLKEERQTHENEQAEHAELVCKLEHALRRANNDLEQLPQDYDSTITATLELQTELVSLRIEKEINHCYAALSRSNLSRETESLTQQVSAQLHQVHLECERLRSLADLQALQLGQMSDNLFQLTQQIIDREESLYHLFQQEANLVSIAKRKVHVIRCFRDAIQKSAAAEAVESYSSEKPAETNFNVHESLVGGGGGDSDALLSRDRELSMMDVGDSDFESEQQCE